MWGTLLFAYTSIQSGINSNNNAVVPLKLSTTKNSADIVPHLLTNDADATFMQWCSDVGITCTGVELQTTSKSVAGRGVFSTQDISLGDTVISIPYYAALTEENAAVYCPALASELFDIQKGAIKKEKKRSKLKRIWNRIRRRREENELQPAGGHWQAALTAYALQGLKVDQHAWKPWVEQWARDDPMQTLVEGSSWRDNDEVIKKAVLDFHKMAPDIPDYKIAAAVGIRLQQIDNYSDQYKDRIPTDPSLYSTVLSRAVGLSDNVTAVLPMHDMINHSFKPNIGLTFADDGCIKLFATKDIPKDQELFLKYMDVLDEEGEWDEDKAAWLLVQWGIPCSRSDIEQDAVQEVSDD